MELQNYELVLILSPQLEDEKAGSVVERLSQNITTKGGTVINIEKRGRRRLAFPIKRFAEGNYVVVRLKLDPSAVPDFEKSLRLSQDVLRHLLVTIEGTIAPAPAVAVAEEGGKEVEQHGESE